jgi:hypothetical protein
MKTIKKGIVKKSQTELFLTAGTRIMTFDENGKPIKYILGSDSNCIFLSGARLFPVR